jgi:hypothetical protein
MLALLLEAALRSLALGGIVWLGLELLRVRAPRSHMTAWTIVLVASLSMPLIMHWVMLTLPSAAPPLQLAKIIGASPDSPLEAMQAAEGFSQAPSAPALATNAVPAHREAISTTVDWRIDRWVDWLALATGIYLLVAGVLLLRLLTGIMLTWRLARAARPLADGWAPGMNVRVSDLVGVPVTFGSIVLLPPECIEWSPAKRQAVLSHERSHVAHGDCYVLLLAALNRAVFWFSPFAWWQLGRLAELAEMVSDDAAIAVLADRPSYAHILLDLAGNVQRATAGIAMARACTVARRVERILAASAVPTRIGWRQQMLIAMALAPVVAICAGSIARSTSSQAVIPPPGASELFAAEAPSAGRQSFTPVSVDPQVLNSYVGYYRLNLRSVFAITRDGNQLFAQLTGERKLRIFPATDREYLYKSAAARITFITDSGRPPAELILHQNGNDLRAVRIADVPTKDHPGVGIETDILDSYVGWYELNPARALAITRHGDRLFAQVTGQPKFEVFARSWKDFVSADGDAAVIFMTERLGQPAELLLHQPAFGARSAMRVDADRAAAIQDAFTRWVAAAPDRFKDQTPAPGGKAAVLQAIDDLQRNAPNYDRMSPQLADSVRRNIAELHAMLTALGAAESIFFRGVGPGGYDIYGAKFANGFAEFRLLMGADGKTEDMVFRPDGDDTPGGFVACSDEPTLKPVAGTAPIKLVLYNASGADIELFELDAQGRRMPYGTIGDDRSAPIQTYVGRPWVVADASGKCREIALPGQHTRFLTVQPPQGGEPRVASRRSAPMPGSEDALRRYIDALTRGEPDYDQMTAEVAAQTRQQLKLYQAILAKLGALRAMSFRNVTQLGNDVYVVHFANGSAEWRIGLVKQGRIGRLALGPQY